MLLVPLFVLLFFFFFTKYVLQIQGPFKDTSPREITLTWKMYFPLGPSLKGKNLLPVCGSKFFPLRVALNFEGTVCVRYQSLFLGENKKKYHQYVVC